MNECIGTCDGGGESESLVFIGDTECTSEGSPEHNYLLLKKIACYRYYFDVDSRPHFKPFLEKLAAAEEFVRRDKRCTEQLRAQYPSATLVTIVLAVDDLVKDGKLGKAWPAFADELSQLPNSMSQLWSLAAHRVLGTVEGDQDSSEGSETSMTSTTTIAAHESRSIRPLFRVAFDYNQNDIQQLRVDSFGSEVKFNSVAQFEGYVKKVEINNPQLLTMKFRCEHCSHSFVMAQPNGNFTLPHYCYSRQLQCEGTRFSPLPYSESSIVTPCSSFIITSGYWNGDGERGNKEIRAVAIGEFLTELITVNGYYRFTAIIMIECNEQKFPRGKNLGCGELQLERQEHTGPSLCHSTSILLTGAAFTERLTMIEDGPVGRYGLFAALVNSIGMDDLHPLARSAILLSIASGGDFQRAHAPHTRQHSHLLVVGEGQSGKSTLMRKICNLVGNGVLVSGTECRVTNLGLAVSQSGSTGSVEAGLLLRAGTGMVVIDDLSGAIAECGALLLHVMSEQRVSVAKGTVNTSFECPVSIVASVRVSEKAKGKLSSLKLPLALLDRFDFILWLGESACRTNTSSTPAWLQTSDKLSEAGTLQAISSLRRFRGEVKFPANAAAAIGQVWKSECGGSEAGTRQLEALFRMCRTLAVVDGRDSVMPNDLEHAVSILRFMRATKTTGTRVQAGESSTVAAMQEGLMRILKKGEMVQDAHLMIVGAAVSFSGGISELRQCLVDSRVLRQDHEIFYLA